MGFPYKEKYGYDREGANVLQEAWTFRLTTTLNNAYRIQFILLLFGKCCSEVIITRLITYLPTVIEIGKNIYVSLLPKCNPLTIDRVRGWFPATMTTQGTCGMIKVVPSNSKGLNKTKYITLIKWKIHQIPCVNLGN